MKRLRHILVPLDLSGRYARELDAVRRLAGDAHTRVTLLHVVRRVEHIPLREMRGFYRSLERVAERKLRAAVDALRRHGLDARSRILIGAPAGEIVRFAARKAVDLIVMRSHRVDATHRRPGWGTTSYQVGALCPCPILLMK